jgi:hypothetical protein
MSSMTTRGRAAPLNLPQEIAMPVATHSYALPAAAMVMGPAGQ